MATLSPLRAQLDLIWSFADQHVLPAVDEDLVLWTPSSHSVTVHRRDGAWWSEMPDESTRPIPEPTVGWLLWHIEWWWGNAVRACRGEAVLGPDEHAWSGSVDGVRHARSTWDDVLDAVAADAPVRGLMPDEEPFWFVAAWVNVELTKNLSEIGQLVLRRGNDS